MLTKKEGKEYKEMIKKQWGNKNWRKEEIEKKRITEIKEKWKIKENSLKERKKQTKSKD